MSGSRSTTGCWTCRIRRKKCDERKPECRACVTRGIDCLGYSRERPAWMQEAGSSWKEILDSEPAKALRRSAEQSYNLRRARSETGSVGPSGPREITWSLDQSARGSPVKEEPDNLWWDSAMFSELSFHSPEAQHLLSYLEVVFHLQFGFFMPEDAIERRNSPKRNWLYQALCENQPLYLICLGLSLSLEAGKERDGNTSGHCLATDRVRHLQSRAIRELQPRLDAVASEGVTDSAASIIEVTRVLVIVMKLISLEIFNETAGAWELHLNAAGRILGMLQHSKRQTQDDAQASDYADRVAHLLHQPVSTEQWWLLRLFATAFAWLDLAQQTAFGPAVDRDSNFFDYLPLLRNGALDTRSVMGCDSAFWVTISRVIELETEMALQEGSEGTNLPDVLPLRASEIDKEFRTIISEEQTRQARTTNSQTENDTVLLTVIYTFAGLVYLYCVVSGSSLDHPQVRSNVAACLDRLENLPARLFIRVGWPFTVAGCMADGQDQQDRFRALITRTETEQQSLGLTWKGIMIMEKCWSLRQGHGGSWSWRNTMEVMGQRILMV